VPPMQNLGYSFMIKRLHLAGITNELPLPLGMMFPNSVAA